MSELAVGILADQLHDELCGISPERAKECYYYNGTNSNAVRHRKYYQDMGHELFTKLEPEIGGANVWPVIKTVIDVII